ncbi:putative pentatricopeptide repeat-containing protein At3g13770, mitochondrial [Selaginella moellendorffii]|nr:putative pentatricopeptide repeat-containing protein At3g13770, mitochondrial [Selaginella moellendorffii]|eukprot:XP_024539724.1 putative pentatricopeptide repeat-containing protein At3g13770, mitochondrial [Selaginella moellendorffii]
MYGKCGAVEDAQAVFRAGEETFVSWNALVAAFADSGMAEKSLRSLHSTQLEGFQADEITLASILNACESPQDLKFGRKVHKQVVGSGWESGTVLGTAVISMYGRCGSVEDAFRAFNTVAEKDLVAMNAIITACIQHNEFGEALNLFRMMQLEGMKPSKATFVSVLNACSSPRDANLVLSCILETTSLGSHESEADLLLGNAVITMHGRCGDFVAAQQAFNSMAVRDVISWNALMVAAEKGDEVLEIFHRMQLEGFRPNKISFVSFLTAASSNSSGSIISSAQSCKAIQALAVQAQVFRDDVIKHGFINLYAKVGNLNQADQVFQDISRRDVVSWNSIIAAYARNATAGQALELFLEMQLQGIAPDGITFVSILSACSHSGQAASAVFYFSSMAIDYGVPAGPEHQGCLVDLFSRSGRLSIAEELSESSSGGGGGGGGGGFQWMMVLGGCQVQNDARRGVAVAERVMEIERSCGAGHVVLSNLLRAPTCLN